MKHTTRLLTLSALLAVWISPAGRAADRAVVFEGPRGPAASAMTSARVAVVQAQTAPLTTDPQQLRRSNDRIVAAVKRLPPQISLAQLIRAVLPIVSEGSTPGGVIDDHRSMLFALAFYVNGWGLEAFVPDAREWPRAERRSVTLRGRGDLSQHFTVSAVIAAFAGTALANAAGLYKEMDDARRGSGFSFSDLAADRAGTTFGEMATKSVESARRLQMLLAVGLTEDAMMPAIAGLPDNLSQAEFTRRFGGVGAPAYNQLAEEIDRRVASLALFK